MSTNYYPQGMASYNNTLHNSTSKSWKGTGYFSNPIGITWGNVRPLTNRDFRNTTIYKHGSARPLKQYRKGITPISKASEDPNIQVSREVKSSVGTNLVSQLMDYPGCFNAFQNNVLEKNNIEHSEKMCADFHGIAMVNNIYPNVNYYENPPVIMQAGDKPVFVDLNTKQIRADGFCCSQPKNALRLLRNTPNLKQNYYSTTYQYLQNRCQTYEQRIFNFATPRVENAPDGPETENYYVANCLPNFIIKESIDLELIDIISRRLIEYNIDFQDIILTLKNKHTSLPSFLTPLTVYIKENYKNKEEILYYINGVLNQNREYLQNYASANKNCGKVVYKPSNRQFATQGAVSASTYILKRDVVTLEKNYAMQNPQNVYDGINCNNCGSNQYNSLLKTKTPIYGRNGRNGTCDIASYGNRNSRYAYLFPPLYDRKYVPNINNTHKHRVIGEVGTTIIG